MSENKRPPKGTTDLIIVSRIADRPDPSQLYAGADAVRVACDDCREQAWYNPQTQIVPGGRAHVICEPCASAYGYRFARFPVNRG